MKNILVTGCAGFIGFHLSKRLLEEGMNVIGLDNLYQDMNIDFKMERLRILLESGLKFYEKDLTFSKDLNSLFETEEIDIVVNLAARTGVRASLEFPVDYINANIIGFCNLCEAAKTQSPHIIYASSSSVYGSNATFPFSESQKTDKPVSIYAATKKSNELLAHYYSTNYGVQMTGLRFFTVYGPWNRKDMAVYLFLDAISKGESIRLFNHGEMKRDFTFVDDISESIYRLIKKDDYLKQPLPVNAVYNIGFGKPETLATLVKNIEENLEKKARIKFEKLQDGDMVNTWADNSVLNKLINYKPAISIEEGLRLTSKWFLNKT